MNFFLSFHASEFSEACKLRETIEACSGMQLFAPSVSDCPEPDKPCVARCEWADELPLPEIVGLYAQSNALIVLWTTSGDGVMDDAGKPIGGMFDDYRNVFDIKYPVHFERSGIVSKFQRPPVIVPILFSDFDTTPFEFPLFETGNRLWPDFVQREDSERPHRKSLVADLLQYVEPARDGYLHERNEIDEAHFSQFTHAGSWWFGSQATLHCIDPLTHLLGNSLAPNASKSFSNASLLQSKLRDQNNLGKWRPLLRFFLRITRRRRRRVIRKRSYSYSSLAHSIKYFPPDITNAGSILHDAAHPLRSMAQILIKERVPAVGQELWLRTQRLLQSRGPSGYLQYSNLVSEPGTVLALYRGGSRRRSSGNNS